MEAKNKNHFQFRRFNELEVGDVFKFSPIIDNDIPSRFFTVYQKTDAAIKFNSSYGKIIYRQEFANDDTREVMIFPYRKR